MPSKHGYRGYGAARTPGSQDRGLQDEKLSAGKIYNAMSKGGGADTGTTGEARSKRGVAFNKAKRKYLPISPASADILKKQWQVQKGRTKAKKVISKLKNIKNQATGFVKEISGYKHGGYRGYGAARTPGSQDYGLQDEKLSAGKIYKAKTGKLISK